MRWRRRRRRRCPCCVCRGAVPGDPAAPSAGFSIPPNWHTSCQRGRLGAGSCRRARLHPASGSALAGRARPGPSGRQHPLQRYCHYCAVIRPEMRWSRKWSIAIRRNFQKITVVIALFTKEFYRELPIFILLQGQGMSIHNSDCLSASQNCAQHHCPSNTTMLSADIA